MSRTVSVALVLSLLGCRTSEDLSPPSSSTLVRSSDGAALYAVNVDEGTISRVLVHRAKVDVVPAGSEPTRLTRAEGRVWVTLRGERTVVAFDEGPSGLTEAVRAEVGAEPYGVVATSDGSRVYVAVSLEDEVLELDGQTLEQLRAWSVPDEPRWLSLDANETALFVASARDGRFTRIDLESGRTRDVELPRTGTHEGSGDPDEDPPIPDASERVDLTLTLTGDPAVSADGDTLAVPVVYADTTTPVVSGADPGGGGGYASAGVGVSRFNPALVLIPLDQDGAIHGEMKAVLLAVKTRSGTLRSYPSGVVSDPDGRRFVVTMEGSDAALVVDTEPFRGQKADERDRPVGTRRGEVVSTPTSVGTPSPFLNLRPGVVGFWERPITVIRTGRGPRGAAFVDGTLHVHAFLDRAVGRIAWEDAVDINAHAARDRKLDSDDEPAPDLDVLDRVVLDDSALSPELLRGQRLFYSAIDRDIAAKGGGVSCASCHMDGRTDGRTWTFADDDPGKPSRRQTPSLAGRVSETAPFTWDGSVASVTQEVALTSHDRMGGRGLDEDQLVELTAFIDTTRAPDTPRKGVDDELVAEGRAIFQREDVACASCHSGPRFTDGLNHDLLGIAANTPTLTGIAATAPYLHDGRAESLRDVLSWARSGAMGDTSMLDDHELDALEAYLRSL